MLCTKCGKQIPEGSKFCEACGAPVNTNTAQTRETASASYDNHQGTLPTSQNEGKKRRFKKRYIAIIAAVIIVVIAVSASSGDPVNTVKHGKFDNYTEKTIGEAFGGFFAKPNWSSYEKNGETYVEFTGECTLFGEKADAEIIFYVDGNRFNVDNCKIGNLSANSVEDMTSVLDVIYAE